MNTNNISRFLFESALYLDLDPARAFGAPGADPESETDMAEAEAEADNDGVCRPSYMRPHPDLLPEGEGLFSGLLLEGEGLSVSRASDLPPENCGGALRNACQPCCA